MILLERIIFLHQRIINFRRVKFQRSNGVKSRPAFTLMELLVYLGISTIVMLVASSFMVDISANAARNRASLEVQSNARLVISRLTQNIRTATSLTVTPTTLTVTVPAGTYVYTRSGAAVEETVAGIAAKITSDAVSVPQLAFSQSGNMVTIDLKVETARVFKKSVPPQELHSTIAVRSSLY